MTTWNCFWINNFCVECWWWSLIFMTRESCLLVFKRSLQCSLGISSRIIEKVHEIIIICTFASHEHEFPFLCACRSFHVRGWNSVRTCSSAIKIYFYYITNKLKWYYRKLLSTFIDCRLGHCASHHWKTRWIEHITI